MIYMQPDGNLCRCIFRNLPGDGGVATTYIDNSTIGEKTYDTVKGNDVLKLNALVTTWISVFFQVKPLLY
jgi:hypothetical protein